MNKNGPYGAVDFLVIVMAEIRDKKYCVRRHFWTLCPKV